MDTNRLLLIGCAGLLSSCFVDLEVAPGALIECDNDADCPEQLICRTPPGQCFAPGGDQTPPAVEPGSVLMSHDAITAATLLTVEFTVTETLATDPVVVLGTADRPHLSKQSQDDLTYVYAGTFTDDQPQASWPLLADLVDRAGNPTLATALGFVRLDFTNPDVVDAHLQYTEDPPDPLFAVSAMRTGTAARVTLTTDEAVRTEPPPELRAACDADPISLAWKPSQSSSTFLVFEHTLAEDDGVDGACPLTASIADVAGNAVDVNLDEDLVLDRANPDVASLDVTHLRHVRVPWGSQQTFERPGQFVVAATLLPHQTFDAVPLEAIAFGANGDTILQARVYDREHGGGVWATIEPTIDGTGWQPTEIAAADLPELWLSAVDAAGNESPRARIDTVEWVASSGANQSPTNPIAVIAAKYAGAGLDRGVSDGVARLAATLDPGLSSLDGDPLAVTGERGWHLQSYNKMENLLVVGEMAPIPVFDQATREILAAETLGGGTVLQWTGDHGHRIIDAVGDVPPLGATFFYDGCNSRIATFGGVTGFGFADATNEHWQWHGTSWQRVEVPPGADVPGGRYLVNVVFDENRGVVVLSGGGGAVAAPEDCDGLLGSETEPPYTCMYRDTWEWDGRRWRDTEQEAPLALFAAAAFNPQQAATWLFGGLGESGPSSDLWQRADGAWSQVSTGTAPSPRRGAAMGWDPDRGAMLLHGGMLSDTSPCPSGSLPDNGDCVFHDLWQFVHGEWQPVTPDGEAPPGRQMHLFQFVHELGGMVLTGGTNVDGDNAAIWVLRGNRWHRWGRPAIRLYQGMATHRDTGELVLFGGSADVGNESGAAADCAALVSGPYEYFQAYQCNLDDTWRFDGNEWRQHDPAATHPHPRSGHSMAYDPRRERTVMFGGCWRPESLNNCAFVVDTTASGGYRWDADDVWEWDGNQWLDASPTGARPPPRAQAAMAFDPTGDTIVLFGGGDELIGSSDTYLDDMWAWNGNEWRSVAPASPWPAARVGAAMATDEATGRVIMHGGYFYARGERVSGECITEAQCPDGSVVTSTVSSCHKACHFGDTWEWRDGAWRELTATNMDPRAFALAFYDPFTKRIMLTGGWASDSYNTCYREYLTSSYCQDLWWLDGDSWKELDTSTYYAKPAGSSSRMRMAYDDANGQLHQFYVDYEQTEMQHSRLPLWSVGVPTVQLELDFAQSGISRTDVSEVRVLSYAAGQSAPFDPESAGASVLAWAWGTPVSNGVGPEVGGRWLRMDTNTAAPGASAAQQEVSWASASADEAQRFLTNNSELHLRWQPAGGAETTDTRQPSVELDYVEIRLRYHHGPP